MLRIYIRAACPRVIVGFPGRALPECDSATAQLPNGSLDFACLRTRRVNFYLMYQTVA